MAMLEIPLASGTRRAGYVLRAWLVAVVPSLLAFLGVVALGLDTLRPPEGALDALAVGYAIVGAPLLETALMLPVATLLAMLVPGRRKVQIVLLTAGCALAHKVGGSWEQVAASAWPFLIYSVTLTSWRERSSRDAFVLTALVHALYNATFFAVGALGARIAGPGGWPSSVSIA
jgi:hypothetical protein